MNSHNFSKDLLAAVGKLLEGNYVKVEGDTAHVLTKEGKSLRSFSRSDYGSNFKKEAYNYLNTKKEEVEVTEQTIVEKKKLDKVDPKELKGSHADRKDGDIDNDGDEDESDEYLHNRRKTVKKAMAKEGEVKELSKKTLGKYIKKASDDLEYHAYQSGGDDEDNYLNSTTKPPREVKNRYKGMKRAIKKLTKSEEVEIEEAKCNCDCGKSPCEKCGKDHHKMAEASNAPSKENGGIAHMCATHVKHATYGEGKCIPGMHDIIEDEEGVGHVEHYDVMFEGENGPFIVQDISVEDLEIVSESHHGHKKKK